MNVLDLPIEKQREIAARRGLSLDQWQEEMRISNANFKAAQDRLDANEGVLPEGWTQEGEDQFQARVDSGSP